MAEGRLPGGDPQGKMKVLVDIPGDARQVIEALGGTAPATQPATQPAAMRRNAVPTTRPGAGPREGLLTFLDNAVQAGTGTVTLRATLPNEDRYFWPGQFVNVRLVLTVKKDAVLVPAQAQQIGQQGPYVYVVHRDDQGPGTGRSTARSPSCARSRRASGRANMLVIDQGVQAGEQVITQGHMMVMPGGPVMVVPPQGARRRQPARARGGDDASSGHGRRGRSDAPEKKS